MGTKNFRVLSDKIYSDPERAARVAEQRREAIAEHIEYALTELRKARGMTQVELAEVMQTAQANVSRIENGDDPHVSTLRRYVEALGGHLEVYAVFGDDKAMPVRVG